MKKFEYKIITGSGELQADIDESYLNELGEKGWELIGMQMMKTKADGLGGKREVYWLKREIKNN